MLKIYRMWRYLRIVENDLFQDPKHPMPPGITTEEANAKFRKLRTISGRNYSANAGVQACFLAQKLKYISLRKGQDSKYFIGMSAEGMLFTAYTGLVNRWAKSIADVPPLVSIIIAIIAIFVSIVALKRK